MLLVTFGEEVVVVKGSTVKVMAVWPQTVKRALKAPLAPAAGLSSSHTRGKAALSSVPARCRPALIA